MIFRKVGVPELGILALLQILGEQGGSWYPILTVEHFLLRPQLVHHVGVVFFLEEYEEVWMQALDPGQFGVPFLVFFLDIFGGLKSRFYLFNKLQFILSRQNADEFVLKLLRNVSPVMLQILLNLMAEFPWSTPMSLTLEVFDLNFVGKIFMMRLHLSRKAKSMILVFLTSL